MKKRLKQLLYLTFLLLSTIGIMELSYRLFLIDFYSNNLSGLNSTSLLSNSENKESILVLGDSFTANRLSYVKHLRDSLHGYNFINSGISGTCITQANIIVKDRIKKISPKKIIYQIYVGNDLSDFKHPYSGDGLSNLRKVYWWLKDRIYIIGYINDQLPSIRQFLKNDIHNPLDYLKIDTFNSNYYSKRTKLNFEIEPDYLENTILLKGSRKKDFEKYLKFIKSFIKKIPENIEINIVIVPHCMQLNNKYATRMKSIGCLYSNEKALQKTAYDFYNKIENLVKSHKNVNVINSLPDLRKADNIKEVYYANDPHLNPYGQKILANTIINALK